MALSAGTRLGPYEILAPIGKGGEAGRPVKPKITSIRQDDTHRLIPSHHSDESVLRRLSEDDRQLQELFELDGATNDRLLGEANLLPGISVHELLFGVAHAHIVNAAFTHVPPAGSRGNGPERGAWYAAFELETAQAEIAFHKAQELQEIRWTESETFTFHDYLADLRAAFHDVRDDRDYIDCLDPSSYVNSQGLARGLLASGSAGLVYPSVRRSGGTCIVCFRPALITNVRQDRTVTLTFGDTYSAPEIS
jgi:RES domain-containing protein